MAKMNKTTADRKMTRKQMSELRQQTAGIKNVQAGKMNGPDFTELCRTLDEIDGLALAGRLLPLTAKQRATNAKRAEQGFVPYVKLRCKTTRQVSPFRTPDELRVSGWQITPEAASCPAAK